MEQPTEQCVQTVRLVSTLAAPSAFAPALPISSYGSWLANAPAAATRPERFRNARLSIVGKVAPERRRRRGRAAVARASVPFVVLVSSMIRPPPTKPLLKLLRGPIALSCPRSPLAVPPCTVSGLAAGLRALGPARDAFPNGFSRFHRLVLRHHNLAVW